LSGQRGVFCAWQFTYRAGAATAAFQALLDETAKCLGPAAGPIRDQAVNHPDFYDLRRFLVLDAEIGISIKDKAALQQTYVFLRISHD
jgi:hypothetical protein